MYSICPGMWYCPVRSKHNFEMKMQYFESNIFAGTPLAPKIFQLYMKWAKATEPIDPSLLCYAIIMQFSMIEVIKFAL